MGLLLMDRLTCQQVSQESDYLAIYLLSQTRNDLLRLASLSSAKGSNKCVLGV